MAPHTPNLAFSFLACACALLEGCSAHAKSCFFFSSVYLRPVGGCSAHAKSCFFFSGVCLCPVGGCSAHAKSCLFFSGVCILSSTSSASRHGSAPSLRSAAGRRLALELLTSSASQPPHSYLKASIGSIRAALFAG